MANELQNATIEVNALDADLDFDELEAILENDIKTELDNLDFLEEQ